MFKRHPILTLLLFLLAITFSGMTIFLVTLDLEDYKEELQEFLGENLSMPTEIGEVSFTIRHGLALDFKDVRIGHPQKDQVAVKTEHLILKLDLLPLLERRLVFHEILLQAPQVELILTPRTDKGEGAPLLLDQKLFESTHIRTLRIKDGSLFVRDIRDPRRPFAIKVEKIETKTSDLSLNQSGEIFLSVQLHQKGSPARFTLKGNVDLGSSIPRWQGTDLNLQFTAENFRPAPLVRHYLKKKTFSENQAFSLDLTLKGTPEKALNIKGAIDGKNLPVELPIPFSATGSWQDKRLTFAEGQLSYSGNPINFSGTLSQPFSVKPESTLSATGKLPTKLLSRLIHKKEPKIQINGNIPWSLKANGAGNQFNTDLNLDLSTLSIKAPWAQRNAKAGSSLLVSAAISPQDLVLKSAKLAMDPLIVSAEGKMTLKKDRDFLFKIRTKQTNLEELSNNIPLLAKRKIKGKVSLNYELSGSKKRPLKREGTLALEDFGMRATKVIADISEANGIMNLSGNQFDFKGVKANLGTSPALVDGKFTDTPSPRLDLWVKAKKMRADELIFPSDTAMLRDLDGHLIIKDMSIYFSPIVLRLDGGTRAKVTGGVKNFVDARVDMHITGEYGNIDEVIALWERPKDTPSTKSKYKTKRRKHSIKVRVKKGTIGGLPFENARGDITFGGDLFTIYPLTFQSGRGYGVGRVEIDSTRGPESVLKISGHVENFDARTVYRDLLKRHGLITGRLNGDFYLEGVPGSRFLPTSKGGFNLEVNDGLLLKFRGLARVFSILNISQIFDNQLPDLTAKGMPFEQLKGSIALREGVLHTEDLFIDSHSMDISLVGDLDLNEDNLDIQMGVRPLQTVDKLVTKIPIAGWVLAGEEKALVSTHFEIKGSTSNPNVEAMPVKSVSKKALGIFKRILKLPEKVVKDAEEVLVPR